MPLLAQIFYLDLASSQMNQILHMQLIQLKQGLIKGYPIIPIAKIVFAILPVFGNDLTNGSSALAA